MPAISPVMADRSCPADRPVVAKDCCFTLHGRHTVAPSRRVSRIPGIGAFFTSFLCMHLSVFPGGVLQQYAIVAHSARLMFDGDQRVIACEPE
ncbi:hypothetical protein Sfum_0521 [Syntrophobacter fumaroxidans MPOB]|uniref:Uncharacterized protein n=1 Tax=Syntrophobacter fumaroxidans (strain DSM 10017 / MPOB) TaxID=335543 RepID=A0LFL9_SYNFM|nr:hypothetical protein Sfum_0521 [Syntrophobacter fumaroxidans MPOB]